MWRGSFHGTEYVIGYYPKKLISRGSHGSHFEVACECTLGHEWEINEMVMTLIYVSTNV